MTHNLNSPPAELPDTVLAGLVRHVATTAARGGLPMESLLGRVGITPAMLADPNGRMPVVFLERLIEAAVEASGDELLGLHMSQRAEPAGFGVSGYIRQACSTLQQTIELTIRYERLVSDIGTTSLRHQPGTALWCWDCKTDNPRFRRQATDYLLGSWVNIQLRLVSPQGQPPILAVHFRHAPPARQELLAEYQRSLATCCGRAMHPASSWRKAWGCPAATCTASWRQRVAATGSCWTRCAWSWRRTACVIRPIMSRPWGCACVFPRVSLLSAGFAA